MFAGRRIVLGVTGGIAAYKAVEVCRRLVDAGAHVIPVLTEGALHFVGRTTFDALGSEKAHSSLWEDDDPIPHTRLGQAADLVLVAPATARLIGTYAAGISDDLLTNVLLGDACAGGAVSRDAHRDVGAPGRAGQPSHAAWPRRARRAPRGRSPRRRRRRARDDWLSRTSIVAAVERVLTEPDLAGLHVLVTAGGTREPIDPVRFLSNRSSGKQGHAIADEAARRGAKVTLVTTTDRPVTAGVDVVHVQTAAEMEQAVLARSDSCDVVVMAAAVADFRPVSKRPARRSRRTTASPRSSSNRRPTSSRLSAHASAPARRSSASPRRPNDVERNARVKLTRKGADLDRGQRCLGARRGLRARHERGRDRVPTRQQPPWR